MMNEAQITVGDLSSFMMYAAYVGISLGGMSCVQIHRGKKNLHNNLLKILKKFIK